MTNSLLVDNRADHITIITLNRPDHRNALDLAISQNPSPVLVVSHGGVFRAFGEIYQFPLRGISNCTLYEFEPLTNSHRIPWRIWCYDANGNKAEHILHAQAL